MRLNAFRWPAVGLALLALIPLVSPDAYFLHILITAMTMAALASSWNLMAGIGGIFSFGHQAMFGLGAYVSALMVMRLGLSPWVGLLVGGLGAALISLIIAVPSLRLRGVPYIAIATLGFAEICRITVMNLVGLTRGELGLWGIPGLFAGANRVPYFYTMLTILGLTVIALTIISRSSFGLALRATRDSQEAADALGVNVTRTKIVAFVVSAFIAGVVGAFQAHYVLILTPTSVLSVEVMIEVVAITLLGGLGTLSGPILGAFLLILSLEAMRSLGDYRLLMYGAVMTLLIIFMPGGIAPRIAALKRS